VDKEKMFETCGSCHARRRDLTGEFAGGDSFHDHYQLTLPDRTDVFYPDGQVRDEDYEWGAFLGSRMHAAGVRCTDCHHPHSAEPILPGNLLCMRCHGGPGTGSPFEAAPVIDEKAHTFHNSDSAGAKCVNCHMPQTTFMQRHGRHDHGFTVPDPLMTKELGIPNSCNRCHTDKDADWSLAAVDKWYGKRMDLPNRAAARTRTRAIAAARRGEDAAREPLLAIAADEKQNPYWRAAAYGLLDQWIGESNVSGALVNASKDASPLVRAAAVQTLAPLIAGRRPNALAAATPLLKDPSRSVRLEVAWAMRREIDLNSPAGRELLNSIEHHLDQPAGRMQLGVLLSSRGRWEMALREFNKAIEWDPNSPPFRYEAAVVLSQLGRAREAVAQLEEAIRRSPTNADFHFAMGLAQHESGDLDKAIASLERAVQLDARHARAWYNLGLARVAKNQPGEAVEALSRGEQADPSDPAIPYAKATVLARLGRTEEAARAARRALELRPNYTEARELLRALGQRP
jgi:tetratricopeptide (TPR) repeat protein